MKDLTGRKSMVLGDDIRNRNFITEWSNQDDEMPSGLIAGRFFAENLNMRVKWAPKTAVLDAAFSVPQHPPSL
jgi:hypothetical protein